jgi:hypothetical protein
MANEQRSLHAQDSANRVGEEMGANLLHERVRSQDAEEEKQEFNV